MTIQIQKQFDNLEDGIQNMIDAAIYDYGQWMPADTEVRIKMNKELLQKGAKKMIIFIFCSFLGPVFFYQALKNKEHFLYYQPFQVNL